MKQEMAADFIKERANELFYARKYEEAIVYYSKAIEKNPQVAIYFTNRSLCYLKLQKWDQACQDSHRALEIDPNSLKAHVFLGEALLELQHFDESVKYFQRAVDLTKEQRLNYGDDITYYLRMAKKKRWTALEHEKINQEDLLQTYLNKLIRDDKSRQLATLCEMGNYDSEDIRKIHEECDTYQMELSRLFDKLHEKRMKKDVPDYLCGKISFEIMKEPVITPSGITYDRKDIEAHLQRVGHFDPVTRTSLTQDRLIPNLALKEVVDAFMAENEWAIDF